MMTSRLWDGDKKQGGGREKESRGGTCSVGLQQRRRLIRGDKVKIRRFKTEKVVCGLCTERLKHTVGRQTGGRGTDREKQRDR